MAGVKIRVVDQNGTPITGANVTINACSIESGDTDSNGNYSTSTCNGWGGPFNYTVGAPGYKEETGTVSKPFYPWQTTNATIALPPAPVGSVNGKCPSGYTLNQANGQCEAVATASVLTQIEDAAKTYMTDLAIIGVVAVIGYALYKSDEAKDRIRSGLLKVRH